jgi:autotransporter-associated beta strand protein
MVAGTNSAVLTGAGASLRKSGSGSVLVTGLNYYSGRTQLDAGVLRAQDGAGLPSGSQLCFNGGILGATGLFSRTIGSSTGMVYWTGNGGFAALGGPLAVRLNGGAAIEWNSTNGFNGKLLYLGSTVADNLTDLQNPISLKGNYTVQVDDNTASTQDVARLSGPIDNGDATARGLN